MSNEIIKELAHHVSHDLHGGALDGYAARTAALTLLASWDDALTDGCGHKLVNDVDETIQRLLAFHAKAVEVLPLKNGGLAGLPLSYWKARLKAIGIEVAQDERSKTWGLRLQGGDGEKRHASEAATLWYAQNSFLSDVSRLDLTRLQMAKVRHHPLARQIEGWVLLADTNACSDAVYLVSGHRDLALPFPYGRPYADFMRARNIALVYAEANPEIAPAAEPAELVITPLAASA
jgi:hypothetical protein